MGGSVSKIDLPEAPEFDTSKLTANFGDVQDYQDQAQDAVNEATAKAEELYRQNASLLSMTNILTIVVLITLPFVLYFYSNQIKSWIMSAYNWLSNVNPERTERVTNLSVNSATLEGATNGPRKLTSKVVNDIQNGGLSVPVNDSIGAGPDDVLTVRYQYTSEPPKTATATYGTSLTITPEESTTPDIPPDATTTTTGVSGIKDGTVPQTIPAANAPKSTSYGYQFWMYINDWNYMFGKDKHVFSRSDPSNKDITSPLVLLHPTDNQMKISVSVYPTEETSKNEPAPAGSTSATDDVFLCEVSGIPIQQWVAVGISVSTRNLDVYLNGNLVKSCLLSGIPKPAFGDIILNDQGGYSGWLCSFVAGGTLTPSDTQAFSALGVPCKIPDTNTTSSTFGFFNSSGNQTSKYVF